MYKSISGIYKITNKINNMFYIGSSTDCFRRFYQHINNLEKSKHINKQLQNAYNKYGKEFFTFEVVQEIERPKGIKTKTFQSNYLFPSEYEIINQYDFNLLYNATRQATGYTEHMCNEENIKKAIETRRKNSNIIYCYDYSGNIINTFQLKKDISISFSKKNLENIYKNNYYSEYNMSNEEVVSIIKLKLLNNFNTKNKDLYLKMGISLSTNGNYSNNGNPSKIVAFNRNGDIFEYKSISDAARKLNISYTYIIDSIKEKELNNQKCILCKSLAFGYENFTFEDAIKKFNEYDFRKINLNNNKKIECVNIITGEIKTFNSIKDAQLYFNFKSGSSISNVLKNRNKSFGNKWIAKYI
jgi:group I intron endonuclease